MLPPPSFIRQGEQGKVCRLKKTLYGLKQSPQAWFEKSIGALIPYGFSQCQMNHSVFIYRHHSVVMLLAVYVDDIVLTASQVIMMQPFLVSKSIYIPHLILKIWGHFITFLRLRSLVLLEASLFPSESMLLISYRMPDILDTNLLILR